MNDDQKPNLDAGSFLMSHWAFTTICESSLTKDEALAKLADYRSLLVATYEACKDFYGEPEPDESEED